MLRSVQRRLLMPPLFYSSLSPPFASSSLAKVQQQWERLPPSPLLPLLAPSISPSSSSSSSWLPSSHSALLKHSLKVYSNEGLLWHKFMKKENDTLPQNTVIGVRGFAKTAILPHLAPQRGIRFFLGSAGVVFDIYKPRTKLPFMQRWFTKEGWKLRKEQFMDQVKSAYAIAKLRKIGYNKSKFYSEATELYKSINYALAQGNRSVLRQLVTNNLYTIMKKEMKERDNVWARVEWEVVLPLKRIETVQARMAVADRKNVDKGFYQITVRILSNQKFAAFDKRDNLVSGSLDKEMLVEDIWVFERPFGQGNEKWTLCARLTV